MKKPTLIIDKQSMEDLDKINATAVHNIKFSIVIPLYNKEQNIKDTIKSALNQNFQNFEIIVINDGSTDTSAQIVESIKDPRIRLIHQKNQGVSAARNRGIKEATNNWVAFLDGDDLWNPEHLEEITKMMQKFSDAKVFTTSFEFSDLRPMFSHPRGSSIFQINNYFHEAKKEYLIWTSIVVVHKDCFEQVGVFNQKLKLGEDQDLWIRIARQYPIIKSQRKTATYMVSGENRAMKKKRNLFYAHEYHYDLNEVLSNDELRFKQHIIFTFLIYYLRQKNFKSAILLYKKHNKLNSLDLIYYTSKKIRSKFWNKNN